MSLDLYAKIESLIGFDEPYEELYDVYIEHLDKLNVSSILDVGCGSGKLLKRLDNYKAFGIDLSAEMIKQSKSKGLNVEQIDICDLDKQYDAVLCVADVLNYINSSELKLFFQCISERLKPNAYFLFDINTLYGFENVADGTMVNSLEDKFLSVDAQYENSELYSEFTLFEKNSDGLFTKEQSTIVQFFHSEESIKKMIPLKFISQEDITLFGEYADKSLMIFQK